MTTKRLLSGKQVFLSSCVVAAGALVVNGYYDFGDPGQLPPLVHWFYVVVLGFNVYAVRYLFRGEQRLLALFDYGVLFTALVCFVLAFFMKESQDIVVRVQSLFLVAMGVSGFYVFPRLCGKDAEDTPGEPPLGD